MNRQIKKNISEGIESFCRQADDKKKFYLKLLDLSEKDDSKNIIWKIVDKKLFNKTIKIFGAVLDQQKANFDLSSIYEIGIHKKTGVLIICNKGATLYSLSPKTNTPHILRHIGFLLFIPGLGIEMVNVGLVGDIYNGQIMLRSESACTPSFLFGSQRCNCAHQWDVIKEVAAHFNKIETPKTENGDKFEKWVQKQVIYKNNKHVFKDKGPGFIMIHIDSQNGMGSGYTEGQFAFDLYSRASIRHRGEYTSEQVHCTTMAGGFRAIGIEPDPRKENNKIGYQVSFIVLDYLKPSNKITFLTNNPHKIECLKQNGYKITRIPLLGEINLAGAQEAGQRGAEFSHLDISGEKVSFKKEFNRLKKNVENNYGC